MDEDQYNELIAKIDEEFGRANRATSMLEEIESYAHKKGDEDLTGMLEDFWNGEQ